MTSAEERHDPGGSSAVDHGTVLAALGHALREAASALGDQTLRSPAAAFRAVAAANRALADTPWFVSALTPLLALGEPSDYVTTELAAHQAQLTEMSRRTAPYREQLDILLESERRLQAAAAERDTIMARVAELRRIEQIAASTADLRAQRDALEARADALARAAADADVSLALAGQDLITVTGDLLEAVGEETREALRRAAEQDRLLQARLDERRATTQRVAGDTAQLEQRVAAAEHEAAAAESEFEQARAAISARVAALTRYAAANRAVSAGLTAASAETGSLSGGTAEVAVNLDEAEKRLEAADAAMAEILTEHQRLRQAAQTALRAELPGRAASLASAEEN